MSQIQDMWLVGFVKGWCSQWCKTVKSGFDKELLEHQRLAGLEQALMLNKTSLMAIISFPVHTGYNLRSLYHLLFGLNIFSYFYVPEKVKIHDTRETKCQLHRYSKQLKCNVWKKWQFLRLNIIYEENWTQTSRREKTFGSFTEPHYL